MQHARRVGVGGNKTCVAYSGSGQRNRAVSWTSTFSGATSCSGRGQTHRSAYHGNDAPRSTADEHVWYEWVTDDDGGDFVEGDRGGNGNGGGGDDGDGDENNFGEEPKPSTPVVLFSLAPAVVGDSFNKTENEDKAVHTDVDLNPTTPQPASRNDELNDPDASSNSSSIDGEKNKKATGVSVIIPALNEAENIESILNRLKTLEPAPCEVIVCIGDSSDDTEKIINTKYPYVKVVKSNRGRSIQMNAGADIATGSKFLFLHADTFVHGDIIRNIETAFLSDNRVVAGGFVSLIETELKTYYGMSIHNVLKTFYAPLLFRPKSFFNGLKVLFGDQAIFCDASRFHKIKGFDEALPIMEDADLCRRLHEVGHGGGSGESRDESDRAFSQEEQLISFGKWEKLDENSSYSKTELEPKATGKDRGRIVLVDRVIHTSGRRIEGLGNLKATAVHFLIGLSWYWGADPEKMVKIYGKFYPPANP